MTEYLPWVNVIVVPVLMYIIKIEKRLVRIETRIELILNGKEKK